MAINEIAFFKLAYNEQYLYTAFERKSRVDWD
jgi:hypothetical protein